MKIEEKETKETMIELKNKTVELNLKFEAESSEKDEQISYFEISLAQMNERSEESLKKAEDTLKHLEETKSYVVTLETNLETLRNVSFFVFLTFTLLTI